MNADRLGMLLCLFHLKRCEIETWILAQKKAGADREEEKALRLFQIQKEKQNGMFLSGMQTEMRCKKLAWNEGEKRSRCGIKQEENGCRGGIFD